MSVSCAIIYCPGTSFVQEIFRGESDPITIAAGVNNITINMQKKYEDLGDFNPYTDPNLSTTIDTSITEYAIPYGYTSISNCTTNSNGDVFQNLKKVIIPDTVTTVGASAFLISSGGSSPVTEVVFADTSGWTATNGSSTSSIDVSNPATNATNLTDSGATTNWIGWTLKKN